MVTNLFITGLGGQGVVTLAKLISDCASSLEFGVSLFNSKGMAQRGGRVTSEIRISDDHDILYGSRLAAGGADLILGMEIGETANSAHFLKEGGTVILMDYAFVPTTMVLKKQEYPDLHQVLAAYKKITPHCFGVKQLSAPNNVYLLGIFSSLAENQNGILSRFTSENLKSAMRRSMKRNIDENLAVFNKGYSYGQDHFSS